MLDHNSNLENTVAAHSCLTLVNQNKTSFTRRKLEEVERARGLYKYHGKPGYNKFKEVVQKK